MKRKATRSPARRPRRLSLGRFLIVLTAALLGPLLCLAAVLGYVYLAFVYRIDQRLQLERARSLPHVYARPLELQRGQTVSVRQLIDYLNDLGYTQRPQADRPGVFAVGREAVALVPRSGQAAGHTVRVGFEAAGGRIAHIDVLESGGRERLALEPPLVTALMDGNREKRRLVPLAAIPDRVAHAVLAIEDRRFYDHPGIDPIRMVGALLTNLRGDRPYLVGGSTLTQQIVKNSLLTPEKTLRRKLLEQVLAVMLEQRLSKDELLELYLNDVYLGQRGSFAIHGVAEAARLFFGKDVSNVTLAEAATMAGLIQSPAVYSPFKGDGERTRERRNVVLQAMVDAGYATPDDAQRASREPLVTVTRALDKEAPYFVDFVAQRLQQEYPAVGSASKAVDVYTTIDLHLQRLAQEAVRSGLEQVDRLLAQRHPDRRAEAALLAVDPRTGEILALVGGRSYPQSQFNRAVYARRQPGSVFKPFVYLAAFERAVADGRTDLTAASLVIDEPTTFSYGHKTWHPGNYGDQYDGPVTWRRALARSRNVAAVKVAALAGYDNVAALWRRIGAGAAPQPFPSIALGVFEASPLDIATAYTVFPNGGHVLAVHGIREVTVGGRPLGRPAGPDRRRVARPDTTYLVANMLRSVMNEGTGAGARAAGFTLDAAGKSGTTNDLRDAWFVGFTPDLLTVVWVGLDDNQPLGLTGTQAALPVWTRFMSGALADRGDEFLAAPEGIVFADIDGDTGLVAGPGCPHVVHEAFLQGTQPVDACLRHAYLAWYNR